RRRKTSKEKSGGSKLEKYGRRKRRSREKDEEFAKMPDDDVGLSRSDRDKKLTKNKKKEPDYIMLRTADWSRKKTRRRRRTRVASQADHQEHLRRSLRCSSRMR
ncbi:hypothetical protein PFISCL1PPCAC_13265, partial [Pristionchus fissidentatus]